MNVADMLWTVARDGMWHTADELYGRIGFERNAVRDALNFLIKYGFAQLDASKGAEEFRLKASSPSPMETVRILRSLTHSRASVL